MKLFGWLPNDETAQAERKLQESVKVSLPLPPTKRARPLALVVDDEPDIRRALKIMLESCNYQVFDFSSCCEAIKYLTDVENAQQVDIIISDLMMGNEDGIDLLGVVNKNPLLDHIKFYLVTGADPRVFKDLLEPYRIERIIEKPFDVRGLAQLFQK